MNDETNKIDAEFDAAWERLGRHSPEERKRLESAPTIRIGSRWRNKAHGFVFRLLSFESIDAGTWVKLYERNASDGFAWAGLESQLLQQWEPIEP